MLKTSFVGLLADRGVRVLDLCKSMGVYWDTNIYVHTKVTLLLFEIYCAFIAE